MATNYDFHYNCHLPIMTVLLLAVLAIVGIRVNVFRRNFCGWKTYRGVSTALIISAALICFVYVCIITAGWFMNEDVLQVRRREVPNEPHPGRYRYRDPSQYSQEELEMVATKLGRILKVCWIEFEAWMMVMMMIGLTNTWTAGVCGETLFDAHAVDREVCFFGDIPGDKRNAFQKMADLFAFYHSPYHSELYYFALERCEGYDGGDMGACSNAGGSQV
jgi:hypothetical protein